MAKYLDGAGLAHYTGRLRKDFVRKTDTEQVEGLDTTEVDVLDIDDEPVSGSQNLITSGAVYTAIGDIEALLAAI